MTFGDSKSPGARHLRIGFREAVPVGSVVVRGGGTLSVLKADAVYPDDLNDDSQWIPARRLVDAEPTRNPILETRVGRAIQQGVGLWTLPPGVKTRAIRFTHVAQPADESYAGRLGGVMVLTDRLTDAPLIALPELKATATPESVAHAPVPVRFHLPEDGFITLVIEDATGKRVRNLVSETPFPAGDNVVWWDATDDLGRDVEAARHGLYNIPAQLVSPGRYTARGLWRKEIQPFYEFAVYGTGNPPWSTPDHTGAWLANHSPPSAAVFVPAQASPTGEPAVFLGCYVTEGPDGFAWLDLDGTKRGGLKWIGGNWTAAPYLGRDNRPNAIADVAAYVASTWETDKQSGISELRVTALLRSGSGLKPELVVTHRLESSEAEGDRFEQLGGIAAHNGVIVCSFRQDDQLLWIDAVAGKVLGTTNVPSPRGVAFDSRGRLLVLSGTRLLRFADASDPEKLSQPETVISEGLDDPFGLTVSEVCSGVRQNSQSRFTGDARNSGEFH